MKKTFLFAAVAAVFTFASCQKAETPAQNQGEDLVFTATIAGQDTKTTVNAATGKVAWESGDEITITDAAETSARYKVSAIKDGRATFIKVDGEPTLGAGPYTAVYGSEPESEQNYSATAPALPMSASSKTTSLEFTVTCGLLELSLKAGENVTCIEVSGTPTKGSGVTYTLTCSPAVSIAGGEKFFIALPEGEYTSFLISGENGAKCLKEGSGVEITANHITPVSFKSFHFAVQLWEGGPYWATTNIGADTLEASGHYFAWGYTEGCVRNSAGDGWVLASDGTTAKQFNTTDFPNRSTATYQDAAEANWGAGWSVPTNTDFTNLINSTNTSIEYVTSGTKGIRITGKGDYASNSIFIPVAGCGINYELNDGTLGRYWSSAWDIMYGPYYLFFSPLSENEEVKGRTSKYYGYPVRPLRSSL